MKLLFGLYDFEIVPNNDISAYCNQVTLTPKVGIYPSGWVELSFFIKSPKQFQSNLSLYYDIGQGFDLQNLMIIPFCSNKKNIIKISLPQNIVGLRIVYGEQDNKITVRKFTVRKLSKAEKIISSFKSQNILSSMSIFVLLKKVFQTLQKQGFTGIKEKLKNALGRSNYSYWIELYDSPAKSDYESILLQIKTFRNLPLFSVIMPVYKTPTDILKAAIASVTEQIYSNWELCIVDDFSSDPSIKLVLDNYSEKYPNIKVHYRETNGNISRSSNDALAMAKGDFVVFMDHDDLLSPLALYYLAEEINKNSGVDFLYTDEDKIDGLGRRYDPYFKPDWNPHLFYGQNYLNHLSAARRQLVLDVGGFRTGFEGAQDWDLYLRLIERIEPNNIVHIARILYHWRALKGSTALSRDEKSYVTDSQEKALSEHFKRENQKAVLKQTSAGYWFPNFALLETEVTVSIIIPTKDKIEYLKRCIGSVLSKTTYSNYEVLIIDNLSQEKESIDYLDLLGNSEKIKVIKYEKPFNFSAINNFAVNQAKGSTIVLLNNDTEIITPDWLEQLISYSNMPEIGAVGTMLYYPDNTIQHAGIILGVGGVAAHAYSGFSKGSSGQFGRLGLVQNMSAVTAACLAIEKKKYLEVGGLNEKDLKIAFNDVDFCIRLLEKGYRNLWTPHVELYHFESVSRGYEDTPEKKKRFESEVHYMINKWGRMLEYDPAYNPNLSLLHSNFSAFSKPRVIESSKF